MTYSWLVENCTKDGKSTGLYMACQVNMTVTADVNAARKFRRQITAEFRALDMREARRGDWRAVEHGFDDSEPPNGPDERAAQPVAGAVTPTADEVRLAAFELCEFIEEIKDKPTDSQEVERFKAGQRYAAKSIRKGLGIWFVDEENSRKTAQAAPAPEPSAQALDIAFELGRVEAMQETSAFNASALRKALSAMLTHFGMDEDEWNKPTLDQARAALAEYDSFTLHPATADLVRRFSQALAEKLAAAEAKYGYSDGWASPDWMDECRAKLMEHIAKGDPRDVAAYCAFLWHHGASTARPEPSAQGRPCPFGCTTQEEHDAHQSAEPSAQGEPVAWRPGEPIYDDAYVRGVAVGFAEDDSRRTTLLRIADRIEARASAPSTPPPAVVEAVPQTWPIERAADMLTAYAELVKATGRYAEEHYIPEIENVAAELRGIAPKAAQPNVRVEGRR